MTNEQRERIKAEVGALVESLANELAVAAEAVADVAFLYIQKHPSWGRNPTPAQKRASHRHWGGTCQACGRPVAFGEAVFHHVQRRVPGQHGPENLLPYHAGCHDDHHGAVRGSLSKGSPARRSAVSG